MFETVSAIDDDFDKARKVAYELLPAMEAVREVADTLEELCDDSGWPIPRYSEMLFVR